MEKLLHVDLTVFAYDSWLLMRGCNCRGKILVFGQVLIRCLMGGGHLTISGHTQSWFDCMQSCTESECVHLGHFVVFTNKYLSHIRSPAGYCFVDFGDYTVSQKVMTKLSGLPIPGSNPVCILVFIKKVKALSASQYRVYMVIS